MHLPAFLRPHVLTPAQERVLVAAIGDAERGNRGEVRVHVERRMRGADPLERARTLFQALGLERTRDGTGVLLYVALDSRRAAVFAGNGIHPRAGEDLWHEVTEAVAAGGRRGDVIAGLVDALGRLGVALRQHVPGTDVHGNEIADEVTST